MAEADAVTLGDGWLGHAIQQGLLRPVPDAEHSSWWVRAAHGDDDSCWNKLYVLGFGAVELPGDLHASSSCLHSMQDMALVMH